MVTICFRCKKEIDTTKEYYGFSDLVNGVRIKKILHIKNVGMTF